MREVAKKESFECEINDYSVAEAEKVGKSADVKLLGPRVCLELERVKKVVSCPVESIEMRSYGMMDGLTFYNKLKY